MSLIQELGWRDPTPLSTVDGTLSEEALGISEARHRQLKGLCQGKSAVILTCGPSLTMIDPTTLRRSLDGSIVIGIKQALDLYGDICNFHLYNEVRMKRYDYTNNDCVRICVSKYQTINPCHVFYPLKNYQYEEALFVTNDYEKWALHNSYIRPWGVGIMFELALQLPIYLGCSRVLVIGFDMNPKGKYHFYDATEEEDAAHYRVDDEEFGFAHDSARHYVSWAKALGVDIRLHSPLSALPIPSIGIENVADFVQAR